MKLVVSDLTEPFRLLCLGAGRLRWQRHAWLAQVTWVACAAVAADAPVTAAAPRCIAPITYLPLDARDVGQDDNGTAALGTYERISPDGRFILRSYSGARLGQVSLMELPPTRADAPAPAARVKVYRTPFSNEAFPVQGTWRYLVDVNGEHYRLADVLRQQGAARPLFKAGMTGFYAAASELAVPATPSSSAAEQAGVQTEQSAQPPVFIRSLSWPHSTSPDGQGVGPLQIDTIEVHDDGHAARVRRSTGPRFICASRAAADGNVYALPMLSVDGTEFSAIPQIPRTSPPSMRVYGLSPEPLASQHPCDMRADLGQSPGKAVFGFAQPPAAAWLTYSDLGHVYVYDRTLKQRFRLAHARHRVLASAFPGLTRDGRVIYGATWRDCAGDNSTCPEQAGYVVVDPYQSPAWRAYWQAQSKPAPKTCITEADVQAERERLARLLALP
ncbi:MAG: hypothetical protein Q4F13_12980 [Pseudomonadota bacterium]|nr:hypothetical protein [Pseudomonadota bacterium]